MTVCLCGCKMIKLWCYNTKTACPAPASFTLNVERWNAVRKSRYGKWFPWPSQILSKSYFCCFLLNSWGKMTGVLHLILSKCCRLDATDCNHPDWWCWRPFSFGNFRGSLNQQEAWMAKCFNQQSDTEQTQTNTVYSMLVLNLWLEDSCWIVWIKQCHIFSQYAKICLLISEYQLIWIACVNILLFCECLFTGTIA